nr:glycosyltransferase family 4 protein [uncultured Dyadobacter sp.]
MHILLLHQYFLDDDEGGGARWNEMSRIWVEGGHSVTVIAGNFHYMQGPSNAKHHWKFTVKTNVDGVRVIRCPVSRSYNAGFAGRILGYLSFALSAFIGGIRFANDRYDRLLITSPPLFLGLPALALAWCKRLPLLLEIRDLWPDSAVGAGVLHNKQLISLAYHFEKYLYQKAVLIAVLTPAFRDKLIQEKGVTPEKIIFIPNAADFRWSEQALAGKSCALRTKLGLNGQFVVIYVGAHGLTNDLTQIVRAAALLKDVNAHFLLIGDGPEKRRLMQIVDQQKISNVSFIDPVPKSAIFEYIVAADAGVSVLKKAAIFKTVYSNKTFDYSACRKPVLMAIDGVSRALIESAEAGVFVEPENPEDFALKVRLYMTNPELVHKHGENGYRFVKAHFDRDVLAKEYMKAILSLSPPDHEYGSIGELEK